jgi:hypothetical protein
LESGIPRPIGLCVIVLMFGWVRPAIGTCPALTIGWALPGPCLLVSALLCDWLGGASAVIEIIFSPLRITSPSGLLISLSGPPYYLLTQRMITN